MNETLFTAPPARQPTVAFAVCGSYCTFEAAVPLAGQLTRAGWRVLPVLSFNAAGQDTRFGTAVQWAERLAAETGHKPITTLQGAEPLGPKRLADAMVIAPCTGTTLAKLALGISNTPVTLGAKSLLRIGCPVVVAVSTNDGLGASAQHIAALLNRKNYYFVPFGQDDCLHKPQSLKADLSLLEPTLTLAMKGRQFQPVLLS
ncbi:MAG: dipicolinate synthase subunit B [Faecalibacterium sp.]|nr:dipicolinate synthase subunit B [Faecalibacterium sp.]